MTHPTTADKGELLPLPEPAEWALGNSIYEVQQHNITTDEVIPGQYPLFTAEQMRDYALANMNRQTNEGHEGLSDRIPYSELMQIAGEAGLGPSHVSGLLQVRLEAFGRKVEALAIARHLSSKQADHVGDGNKMVKADTVKMPVVGFTYTASDLRGKKHRRFAEYWTDADERADPTSDIEAVVLERQAIAHTAEAILELVDGLRDASKDMRAAALTIDDNPGGAINDTIWHGMVTLYDHLCASAEQVERTLAKYAPSQEGGNRG